MDINLCFYWLAYRITHYNLNFNLNRMLSNKEREELNRAVLQYLQINSYSATAESFE